ncbi:MAG TPA: aldo/keto reductase [Acidimicrobiales bacterium]|jgi:2,5-diketo-D-gluconate reductase A|nr:aldo/keto reductase [Acidimicrobiales bacterium]
MPDPTSPVPLVTLNNGVEIPQLGFGVFQIDPADTRRATLEALEVGYRHIDTAEMYRNEAEVGQAVHDSGIARSEIFVTSKLNNGFHRPEQVRQAFEGTLAALDIGYLDLFLIHWPLPTLEVDYLDTWKAMEELLDGGQVRAIGVSNFQAAHLQRLFDGADVVPAVNQIELHPYLAQDPLRELDRAHGIATEAWSPIAQGKVLDDPAITAVASEVGRTPAQVVLRWHLQRGEIVFPKSVTRSRVEENFALFDFELSDRQVAAITALDRDGRIGPDPDTFDYVPS